MEDLTQASSKSLSSVRALFLAPERSIADWEFGPLAAGGTTCPFPHMTRMPFACFGARMPKRWRVCKSSAGLFLRARRLNSASGSSRILRGPMTPGCESRLPCTRLRFAEFDCLPTDHEFLITRHCSNKATLPILGFAARRLARHQHGGRSRSRGHAALFDGGWPASARSKAAIPSPTRGEGERLSR